MQGPFAKEVMCTRETGINFYQGLIECYFKGLFMCIINYDSCAVTRFYTLSVLQMFAFCGMNNY